MVNAAVDQRLLPGQRAARRPRPEDCWDGPLARRGRVLAARPGLLAAGFLVLSLLTHLPGFKRALWNPDEAFLGTQGRVLAGGGRLYVDVVDRKPPILPYLYALAVTVSGDNAIWLMRGLAVLAHTATALLLAAIAGHLWSRRAGLAAGALYLLASPGLAPDDAQVASFEVFMLPLMVGAVYLALRGRFGWAGLALAGATLTKQVAGATLLPLILIALSTAGPAGSADRRSTRAWPAGIRAVRHTAPTAVRAARLGLLLAAYAVPLGAAALLFGWDRFWFWVMTGSGEYLDAAGAIPYALSRGFGNLGLLALGSLPLVMLAFAAILTRSVKLVWWLWLASAVGAVSVGLRFFGHYYLQIIPPLVIVAVAVLRMYGPRVWRAALVCGLVSAAVFTGLAFTWGEGRNAHSAKLATVIRTLSAPEDRLLVWGMHPEVYWLADRPPATRFITAGFLTNAGGGRPDWRVGAGYGVVGGWPDFDADVGAHPPTLIVDDSDDSAFAVAKVPRIANLIADGGYVEVARVDGAVIYRRAR
jgi:4-amino-4-deoxy-L-arabinose transferase-like glycosyltransferase